MAEIKSFYVQWEPGKPSELVRVMPVDGGVRFTATNLNRAKAVLRDALEEVVARHPEEEQWLRQEVSQREHDAWNGASD